MNDEQWLGAIAKHNSERTDWRTHTGGAYEQSHVLQEQTKSDPERFSRLALRFDESVHAAYGDAILMGLGNAEALADPASVFEAVRHIASLGHEANNRWLGSAIRKYLKTVPQDIVQLIVDRATGASDPADGSLTVQTANQEHTQGRDLYTSGINSSRGSAAEILGAYLRRGWLSNSVGSPSARCNGRGSCCHRTLLRRACDSCLYASRSPSGIASLRSTH
jgi:hypothetical protein